MEHTTAPEVPTTPCISAATTTRAAPFNAPFNQIMATHTRNDRYFTTAASTSTSHGGCPFSKHSLKSKFTAENWYKRVTVYDDATYLCRDVVEAVHADCCKLPATWTEFKESFMTLDQFRTTFEVILPETFPPACTTDHHKMDFALGLPFGSMESFVARWDTTVFADVLVIARGGVDRFQPAFAGLFLFYSPVAQACQTEDQAPLAPLFYIIVSADGAGTAQGLFINKMSTSDHQRHVQGLAAFKFSPLGHPRNYYSHFISYNSSSTTSSCVSSTTSSRLSTAPPSRNRSYSDLQNAEWTVPLNTTAPWSDSQGIHLVIDCYREHMPPTFYFEETASGNNHHLRVSVSLTPQASCDPTGRFYAGSTIGRYIRKGCLMSQITAPYVPMASGYAIWRFILDPLGIKSTFNSRSDTWFGYAARRIGLICQAAVFSSIAKFIQHYAKFDVAPILSEKKMKTSHQSNHSTTLSEETAKGEHHDLRTTIPSTNSITDTTVSGNTATGYFDQPSLSNLLDSELLDSDEDDDDSDSEDFEKFKNRNPTKEIGYVVKRTDSGRTLPSASSSRRGSWSDRVLLPFNSFNLTLLVPSSGVVVS